MSCTDLTPAMSDIVEQLRAWPDVDPEELRRRPEWDQARAWGWVMEPTGTGLDHAGTAERHRHRIDAAQRGQLP